MTTLENVKVLEPRVNVKADTEKDHIVLQGGLRVNEQINVADSWGSAGATPVQASWTINPPSTSTIVDRNMKIRAYFEVSTDQPLQLGLNDALRQFPIASIMDVLTVQINGETISDNMADKIHAMLCFGNDAETRRGDTSTSPNMPDNYQEYSDYSVYGSGKNSLSNYGEQSVEEGRGGFPVEVISPTSFRVVLTEPMFLSPFLNGLHMSDEGFVNVNQMNINMRWKQNINQLLSHSSLGNAITSVSVSMYQAPEILTTFITPDLTQPIPQLQVLPYNKTQEYIKQMSALNAGASTTVVSDSIKLSQVPRKLYLFCRHQRSTSDFSTADSFLAIQNLSVLWNNQSGLFSSASPQDLYRISKDNGLNLTWSQFSKYRGSVFCAEFGKDIGLLDSEAPGCQGQYTIQVQMNVKNESSSAFTGEFYMVVLNEGTFSISENFARASLGNLNQQMVLMAKQSPELHHMTYRQLQGAGFFSGLKNIVNKIARGVQSVAQSPITQSIVGAIAPEFSGVVKDIGQVAGVARKYTGGRVAGGGVSGGRMSGGKSYKRLSRR
jgi:hypothetical protein